MAYYVKETVGDLVLEVGFDTIVELKDYLREVREGLTSDSESGVKATAYRATCGHDSPADEYDYPGEPERDEPVTGLTGAELSKLAEEWRKSAKDKRAGGNSWAASSASALEQCADAIDPVYCIEMSAEAKPDALSYTVEEVFDMVKALLSILDTRASMPDESFRSYIRNFKGK